MNIKKCISLEEIREEIDKIDEQIADLIALRNGFVKQAANFKQSVDEIKAEDRIRFVVNRARERGIAKGVNPNLMEEIYRLMINKMVETELLEFRDQKGF